jgi:NADPH2:quinone reductase
MPRAVIADELGPLSNYSLRSHDPGPPGPKDVRIAVKAIGVSFVDVLASEGRYQVRPPVPFIPGSECAGVVEAVGAGVTSLSAGQRVIANGWHAMFAEVVNAPARSVWAIPDSLSFEAAAVFMVSYMTAWHGLIDRADLKAGETLLVLGAGGATGVAAVQIGLWRGARVIASASSEAKRRLATEQGAHAAVDSGSPAWRDEVKAANGGRPVDVVFDPVGGDATELAFRSLGWKGRHLVVGFPAGIPAVPTNLPLLKGASLVGVNLGGLGQHEPELGRANQARVLDLAAQGIFSPTIAERYPLEDFAKAMAEAARGDTAGRILLIP